MEKFTIELNYEEAKSLVYATKRMSGRLGGGEPAELECQTPGDSKTEVQRTEKFGRCMLGRQRR